MKLKRFELTELYLEIIVILGIILTFIIIFFSVNIIKNSGYMSEKLLTHCVGVPSKHSVGDSVRTKENICGLLRTHILYRRNDNTGIEEYLGKDCKIVEVRYTEEYKCYIYLIDIDNGDYWWVDESFTN